MHPTHRPPTSPGEMLVEEFLKPRGITQRDAAKQLGISVKRLNDLIRGKCPMSADMALRLALFLRTTREFWMNLSVKSDVNDE